MDIEKIESLLASYAQAWANNDAEQIATHWDETENQPFYKAEEVLQYHHSLQDIKAYWQHNEHFHEAIRLSFSDISVKPLPGDYAIVFIYMRWDIQFAKNAKMADGSAFSQAGKLMGGENHVLALLKQSDSGLKLAGWSETPNAPITYMRQLYEWVADPAVKRD